jgi:hypothetical protein
MFFLKFRALIFCILWHAANFCVLVEDCNFTAPFEAAVFDTHLVVQKHELNLHECQQHSGAGSEDQ